MIELHITGLTHAGEGVGRHEGLAVFVPHALPGETVRVELVERKKRFARARLVEVVVPAPERRVPRCPHHFQLAPPPGFDSTGHTTACGGCQLQHLDDAAQLAFKQRLVREQLTRIGGLAEPLVRPTLPSPAAYYYRNHAQFSLTPEGRLGFWSVDSRRVVALRECHQIEPPLGDLFGRVSVEPEQAAGLEHVSLRAGAEGETLVVLEVKADEAPEVELDLPVDAALLRPDGTSLALAGRDNLVYVVRGRPFRVSAGSFFQVNTVMAERLVDLVLEGLALRGGEAVLDLYCGVGLFTAFLAPTAGRVVGVESFAPAVADAAINLDEFDRIEIYEAAVEAVLPALQGRFDAVVLDPPRAGCVPAALDALLAASPARIVYVSCDPATLARDARRLTHGGYGLEWAQPLDMFPQTFHVECVALFTLGIRPD
jgi:23S rRNA (uracil1939-C5)-methyltransferase